MIFTAISIARDINGFGEILGFLGLGNFKKTSFTIPNIVFVFVFQSDAYLIQTEAERRRREAGVKQSMELRVRSCMYVCMYGIWSFLANQGR